jgi:hypothetical protein
VGAVSAALNEAPEQDNVDQQDDDFNDEQRAGEETGTYKWNKLHDLGY